MKRIGLIYAMEGELESLRRLDGMRKLGEEAGVCFYEIAPELLACVGGVGKVNIAMAAQLFITRYQPEVLLNVGVAGAVEPLPVGAIALVHTFVQHDYDTSAIDDLPPGHVSTVNRVEFACDDVERAGAILTELGVAYLPARVATGDWFATDSDRARWIREQFRPDLCEMEGCAIAQVCVRNGVKFLALKGVSDRIFSELQTREFFDFPKTMERLNEVALPFAKKLQEVL